MNKGKLIPKLAIEGIRKNGSSYFPYILITSFSVFVFFIFNAICDNPMMKQMPHADYLLIMMNVGKFLLGCILAPLIISTNRFLIKQRKGELGLYNVLGLDRKYIGGMMVIETVLLYLITCTLGMMIAGVFSKLVFLILLNLAGLTVDVEFTTSLASYVVTLVYFGVAFILNLLINLFQVGKAKPIELMKSSKRGERQEKYLLLRAIIGIIILLLGYGIALKSQMNTFLFLAFLLSVELVVLGTRSLFKSGTIITLLKMKKTPKIYYQKSNFITISDMLYRMKRNAQSLANICIFSTMVMITLLCTVSLFIGGDNAIRFSYPMDVIYDVVDSEFNDKEALQEQIKVLSKQNNVEIKSLITFHRQRLAVLKEGNAFVENKDRDWYLNNSCSIYLIPLEEYNQFEGRNVALEKDEVLFFSSTKNLEHETLYLNDKAYKVKEELSSISFDTKQPKNLMRTNYYLIMKDEKEIAYWAEQMGATNPQNLIYSVRFNVEGDNSDCDAFVKALDQWITSVPGGVGADYFGNFEKDTRPMYGALLFLGIFFGIIFSISLVLMMYYKQITEGYEDKKNFMILKQVGMSDKEIRGTIKKQVLTVFFLPVAGAIMHTFVGLHMVSDLMCSIHVYNSQLILFCTLGVIAFFILLYGISYVLTSKAYYRIVK